jgi:hypothetical protein
MQNAYTKTGTRIALIVGVVLVCAYAFLVQGEGAGFTFATNTTQGKPLELKIDSTTYYNGSPEPQLSWSLKNLVPGVDKFWNFGDVKPGDTGTSSISIHIKNGPAYMCLDFYNFKDFENGINEPESKVDTSSTTGELAAGIELFSWLDDGDKKFEVGEKPLFGTTTQAASTLLNNTTYVIADSLQGTPIPNGVTKYIGMYWCAGDLNVNVAAGTASCNGEVLGNEAQTDSMSVDIGLRAVVASAQPNFTCNGVPPPVNWCEFEGHKYDEQGNPLQGWDIGLMKKITHNKGVDRFDLATATTDVNGYFCLDWNGEKRVPIGTPTYTSGPYSFEYFVYEKMKPDWQVVSIEKGASVPLLAVVPGGQIIKDGIYTMVSMGSGYIYASAGYHVDFYNEFKVKEVVKKEEKRSSGGGGGGSTAKKSESGKSKELAKGFSKKHEEKVGTTTSSVASWQKVKNPTSELERLLTRAREMIKQFRS